jgi:hypothetical protein
MGLETGSYIKDLVPTNPQGTDPKSQGDDHLRLIKSVLQNTLPVADGPINLAPDYLEFVAPNTANNYTLRNNEDGSFDILRGTTVVQSISANGNTIIKGTTTNDNAAAGMVGEYIENSATGIVIGSGGSPGQICTLSLSAGDWDISGGATTAAAGTTTTSQLGVGVSQSPTTYESNNWTGIYASVPAGGNMSLPTPVVRKSFASPTAVYLLCGVTYAISTLTVSGLISARRVR